MHPLLILLLILISIPILRALAIAGTLFWASGGFDQSTAPSQYKKSNDDPW